MLMQSKCYCQDCGYVGTKGYWKGAAILSNGKEVPLIGEVELDMKVDGEAFDLDPLIEKIEQEFQCDVDDFTGEVYCPICNSENFFSL